MDIFIVVVIFLIIGVIFLVIQQGDSTPTKNTALKKEEIIQKYEDDLKDILTKYENNQSKQIEQKKLYLQKCSSEFSRNIFFSESEAKQIIQKLAKL
ncbi:MAG: hypothetical protein U9Q20_01670 [Campylobacterota bacterium]|nr:hypothetical protein [Campylobacterota bacterium]